MFLAISAYTSTHEGQIFRQLEKPKTKKKHNRKSKATNCNNKHFLTINISGDILTLRQTYDRRI